MITTQYCILIDTRVTLSTFLNPMLDDSYYCSSTLAFFWKLVFEQKSVERLGISKKPFFLTTQELVEVIDALEVEEVETGVGSFESEQDEEEEEDCAASQKGIGYEAMRLINPSEQMPMCVSKVKEVTSYLENKGSSGPHVERYAGGLE